MAMTPGSGPAAGGQTPATPVPNTREINRSSAAFRELMSTMTDAFKKAGFSAEEMEKVTSQVFKNLGMGARTVEKSFSGIGHSVNKVKNNINGLKGDIERMAVEKGLDPAKVKDFYDEIQKLDDKAEDYAKAIVKMSELDAWNVAEMDDAYKLLHDMEKEAEKLNREVEAASMPTAELVGEFGEGLKTLGGFSGVFKGSAKQMQEHAGSAKLIGDKIKNWGTGMAKANGLRGLLGKGMISLGGSIGGISKLLGGWPGLIAMAVVKAVDMYMKMDKYIKDINKGFANIRGPDIMTEDINKQFRDFNKQIFNIGENLKVGFSADQIREFMSAVASAGLRVQSFNDKIHTYRDAVTIAAKASKTLGLELPAVGAIMGELATEFKMDLEDMDAAFVQVAFDAGRSGLTTDKFLGAVQNASSGLAFYGKFLDGASKSMRALTESQLMGAKEAGEATQEMFQLFKGNTIEANAALAEFAKQAGVDMDGEFKNAAKIAMSEVDKLQSQIEVSIKNGATDEQVGKLRKEMAAAADKANRAQKMVGKNSVIQATEMGLLSDQTPDLLMKVINRVTESKSASEITGEKLIVAMRTMEKFGVKNDTVRELIRLQTTSQTELEQIYGVTEDANGLFEKSKANDSGFYTKANKASKSQTAAVVSGLDKLIGITDEKKMDEAVSYQTSLMKQTYGVQKDVARAVAESAAADPEFNKGLQDILTQATEGGLSQEEVQKKIGLLLKTTKAGEKRGQYQFKHNAEAQKDIDKAAEHTFNEVVNQTLSMEEAKDIAKDGIKYNMATLLRADRMVAGVTNITRMLAEQFHQKDPAEKDAEKALKKLNTVGDKLILGAKKEGVKKALGPFGLIFGKQINEAFDASDRAQNYSKALVLQKESKDKLVDLEKKMEQADDELALATSQGDQAKMQAAKDKKEKFRKDKKIADANLKKSSEIIDNTKVLIDKNEDVAKSIMNTVKGNEKATQAIVDEISTGTPDTMTKDQLDDMLRKKYIDPNSKNVKKAIDAIWTYDKEADTYKRKTAEAPAVAETGKAEEPKAMQGIKSPMMVTNPGAVVLHPKEMVLPADYSGFKAKLFGDQKANAAPAAPATKNINIVVNATETNLANKIANEIKAHLYKDSLTEVS